MERREEAQKNFLETKNKLLFWFGFFFFFLLDLFYKDILKFVRGNVWELSEKLTFCFCY